uniref:Uncharacterized protein n=1 Tax=Eutreptiella gymnastica TaxID=73025 RepID=A0A7S4CWD8_9EUGL|mmetsp:Transcript_63117/g.104226  ORF Transcript_63117/g.104226 Transcript_63117/m.104226 type:complete len:135 (+) Transcript_63117:1183-1587(+)
MNVSPQSLIAEIPPTPFPLLQLCFSCNVFLFLLSKVIIGFPLVLLHESFSNAKILKVCIEVLWSCSSRGVCVCVCVCGASCALRQFMPQTDRVHSAKPVALGSNLTAFFTVSHFFWTIGQFANLQDLDCKRTYS